MTTAPLIIIGSGGHGRVVLDCAVAGGWRVAGFLDRAPLARMVDDVPILGGDDCLDDPDFVAAHRFIVALGNQAARRRVSETVAGRLATVIHPSAVVSPRATIGAGTVVVAGAVVNTGAKIGRFCILNTGCTIDHDCQLADGVQICPGVTLAGGVVCGDDVFIGSGAVLLPTLRIGDRAIIGAGSVVLTDVAPGTTVVGNPAASPRQR